MVELDRAKDEEHSGETVRAEKERNEGREEHVSRATAHRRQRHGFAAMLVEVLTHHDVSRHKRHRSANACRKKSILTKPC